MARFIARCAMRWSDMDAYGHVNNTAYLAYLEQARVSMFFDRYDSSFAGGTLVTHHEITYLRPVVYHPEPLRLELWVERIRGASFDVRYDVYDGQTLAAKAVTTLVTFDFTTDRPRRLTADEKAILNSYLDEPADQGTAAQGPAAGRGEATAAQGQAAGPVGQE
ncbi:MAG TPA: thioesterase family protein [Jatrophihabitans sp.]|uniref:acyl-CoA thioesterase n=1 Tax=Jatrophihabitans sp. TaxID=1932789 RepID=UPI002F110674